MSRVKQSDKQVQSIIPELLTKDFIKNFGYWWHSYCWQYKIFGILPFALSNQVTIRLLKNFQKEKTPEFLGKAIRANPCLLDHPLIRRQLFLWIFEMGQFGTPTEKATTNITLFVKGLIPKPRRSKLDELPIPPEAIREAFNDIYKRIKEEFHKRKPRTRDERASILKELCKGTNILHIDRFCEKWAREKEPRRITELIVQETLHIAYTPRDIRIEDMVGFHPDIHVKPQYKIGSNILKGILKKSV